MIERSPGIDAGRVVMVFLVVTLHSLPSNTGTGDALIAMACRAAVPYFLITSGYFLKTSPEFSSTFITKPLLRLAPIYITWMVVYYGWSWVATGLAPHLGAGDLLAGGMAFHLWYLPAAGFALALIPTAIALVGARLTGAVCLILAVAAIVMGGYHDVLGLPGKTHRGGLLVAPMFVFIGYALAQRKSYPSTLMAVAIAASGFAVLLVEEVLISRRLGGPLVSNDFMLGTFIYAAGVFLFARSLRSSKWLVSLGALGVYALGIYASHLLFLWVFGDIIGQGTIPTVFVLAGMSFVGAALLTIVLYKVPRLRPFVA